jgi:iron complex outermembrane recepter protein
MTRSMLPRRSFRRHAFPLLASSIAAAALGHGQQSLAGATAFEEELEEVTVTAQRRPENLQAVPVAVTALSGAELNRRQIYDVQALQYAVPSMVVNPTVSNSLTATISLRGWGEPDFVPTVDPAVGVYLDGVYIARATGANLDLFDMQRVEVLRGPQGTLFGRDAIGGAINLVPNPPEPQFAATLGADLGNYNERELRAILNLPLGAHHAALRVAATHTEHDGFGEAVYFGLPLGDDDTDYVRAQLQVDPNENWRLNLSVDLTRTLTGSQRIGFLASDPTDPALPPAEVLKAYHDVAPRYLQDNRAGKLDANIWGTSATLAREQARYTLESITAYRSLEIRSENTDADGTPYELRAVWQRGQTEHQFSEELQVRSKASPDQSSWVAGLLYFTETANLENDLIGPYSPDIFLTRGTAKNSSWAAYSQLGVPIGEALRLTAGVRYNVDWRQLISRNAIQSGGVESCWLSASLIDPGYDCQATLPSRKYSYLPFTLGMDYALRSNTLLYAKLSRGYRAGGYNMRGGTPSEFASFSPENVTSYEIGAKADLLHERLRSNLALYLAHYKDVQLGQFVPDPVQGSAVVRQNAGQARIQGAELELTGLIGHLQLAASVGLADGRFTQLNPGALDVTLDSTLALPRTTYSLAADLPLAFGAGSAQLHADYAWRSDDNDGVFDANCQCHNAYGLLNVHLGFQFKNTGATVSLWARNLGNTRYSAQSVDFGYLVISIPGDPQTYGVAVDYNFGAHPSTP